MKYSKSKPLTGEIVGLFRSEKKNSLESTAYNTLEFAPEGIVGDNHAGMMVKTTGRLLPIYPRGTLIRNNRHWSMISEDELAEIAQRMGVAEIRPEWLGANIVVRGVADLTKLPPLSIFIIRPDDGNDKIVLTNYGENDPCIAPHRKIVEKLGFEPPTGFVEAAIGRRGLVGWVEKTGVVSVGDTFKILLPKI